MAGDDPSWGYRRIHGELREHVPDFLAVFRDGSRWLFDVRPARLSRAPAAARAG